MTILIPYVLDLDYSNRGPGVPKSRTRSTQIADLENPNRGPGVRKSRARRTTLCAPLGLPLHESAHRVKTRPSGQVCVPVASF